MCYAMSSYFLNIPRIKSMYDLSRLLNLSEYTLNRICFASDRHYKEVEVKKNNGDTRILAVPGFKLKTIQYWILRNILEGLPFEDCATAFKKKHNIRDNLNQHVGKEYFLCLDIKNFFGSISKTNTQNFFRNLGYNSKASRILSNLCTYENSLPQGGVTSPSLSNLLNIRLDKRLKGFLIPKNIIYTRYADDIILSSNHPDKLLRVKNLVEKIINSEGYRINHEKIRLLRPGNKRKIIGLVYSDDQTIGIGRKQKRLLRAKIHNFETKSGRYPETNLNKLLGWMSFLKDVDPKAYNQLSSFWLDLKEREDEKKESLQKLTALF